MRVQLRADEPVWFVLGQSHSVGWHAAAEGRDLGEPVLVDGFANGWLVDPGPDGVVVLDLEWRPQRLVRSGLIGSVAGALVCLAILVTAAFRRRRAAPVVAPAPSVRSPFLALGPPLRWSAAAGTGLVVAVAAGLVVSPLLGAAAGLVALIGLRHPLGRLSGPVGAGFIGAAGLYTAFVQIRDELVPDFGWTDFLAPAHVLAWAGLMLLGVALVTDWRRR